MAIKVKDDRIGNKKSYLWLWLLIAAFVIAAFWFYGDDINGYARYYSQMYFGSAFKHYHF